MDTSLFSGNLVTSSRIICTPSVFAKTNMIYLQEIGELHAKQPHTSRRENLTSYLFFLVLSGSGTLEYDGSLYTLSKGDCVFLDCRKTYFHRSSENLWSLKWIHFYGSNMNGIYNKYTERGGLPCFHPQSFHAFEALWADLYLLASSDIHIRDMKIFEKLASLLSLLMEESWNPELNVKSSAKKQNLQNVKEYLEHHYNDKITLDALASNFYINKFYLTRIFKEQFGISINSYLQQIRITHAKQLLRFTDYTIEKIGSECGMKDANYFTRTFKKIEGISPTEYRKQW